MRQLNKVLPSLFNIVHQSQYMTLQLIKVESVMNLVPTSASLQITVIIVDIMMDIKSAGQRCDLNSNFSCRTYYLNLYQVIC